MLETALSSSESAVDLMVCRRGARASSPVRGTELAGVLVRVAVKAFLKENLFPLLSHGRQLYGLIFISLFNMPQLFVYFIKPLKWDY